MAARFHVVLKAPCIQEKMTLYVYILLDKNAGIPSTTVRLTIFFHPEFAHLSVVGSPLVSLTTSLYITCNRSKLKRRLIPKIASIPTNFDHSVANQKEQTANA